MEKSLSARAWMQDERNGFRFFRFQFVRARVDARTSTNGADFTFTDYRNLKRKPPKDETKPETKPALTQVSKTSSIESFTFDEIHLKTL